VTSQSQPAAVLVVHGTHFTETLLRCQAN